MVKALLTALAVGALTVSCSSPEAPGEHGDQAVQATKEPSVPVPVKATRTPGDQGQMLDVVVQNGHLVKDPGKVKIPLGQHVVLTVTTDVADELHVHGYDLTKETVPGKPVSIEFDATIPGQFEAELHHTHLTLVAFQVR